MVKVSHCRRYRRSLKNSKQHASIKKIPSATIVHVTFPSTRIKSINDTQNSSLAILDKTDLKDKSLIQPSKTMPHSVRVIKTPRQHHSLKMNISVLSNNESSQNISTQDNSTITISKNMYCSSRTSSSREGTRSRKDISIEQSDRWNLTREYHRNKRQISYKHVFTQYCRCSRVCAIGCIITGIIFGIIIASILIATVIKPNRTTTTTMEYDTFTTTATMTNSTMITTTTTNSTTMTTIMVSTNNSSTTPPINQTLLVPENTRINITCSPPLPTINIVYAYYGTKNCTICNCTRMDFTANVTSYCASNGNPSICTFQAGNSFFSDTCNLVAKKLWLTYFCN